ncbi:hypothetical protein PsorP6_000859 [Peronosclerospora sorghi]|uniref:Uncharacterized protein n=1 Tax=Peronosclerospora sorghi TaxID=230839 RepID=A0ACC0WXQ7_9STRA|nr:hypothetical protein PsorP6_000859 [Peronosclerospora sorghi]
MLPKKVVLLASKGISLEGIFRMFELHHVQKLKLSKSIVTSSLTLFPYSCVQQIICHDGLNVRSIASQSASMSSRNNRAVLHKSRGGLYSWPLRSSVASIAAKTLQGHTTLVSQQREDLEKLVATLIKLFNARYINDSECEALGADDNSILSTDGRFRLNTDDIRGFLEDLGTFVVDCVETLTEEDLRSLLLDLGHAVLKLISGIGSLSDERSSTNEAGTALPAVLPHQLVQLRRRDFYSVARTYRERLLTRWSTSRVDLIEQEFLSTLATFESEEAFKNDTLLFFHANSAIKPRGTHCSSLEQLLYQLGTDDVVISTTVDQHLYLVTSNDRIFEDQLDGAVVKHAVVLRLAILLCLEEVEVETFIETAKVLCHLGAFNGNFTRNLALLPHFLDDFLLSLDNGHHAIHKALCRRTSLAVGLELDLFTEKSVVDSDFTIDGCFQVIHASQNKAGNKLQHEFKELCALSRGLDGGRMDRRTDKAPHGRNLSAAAWALTDWTGGGSSSQGLKASATKCDNWQIQK